MTTRLVWEGRTIWSNERRRPKPTAHLDEKYVRPIVHNPPLPPSAGGVFYDEVEDLNYRVVRPLNPLEGWCLMDQLVRHYQLPPQPIIKWCRMGLIDAVIEEGSAVRRYRVRAVEQVEEHAKKLRAKIAVKSKDTVELRRALRQARARKIL